MKKAMKQAAAGSIFDGYPRNLKQAELLEKHLHDGDPQNLIILFLNLDSNQVKDRIIHRKTCKDCGEILNNLFKKPLIKEQKEHCLNCQSINLLKRSDDNEESLANRLKTYNEKTYPVVEYYRSYKNFNEIDTTDSEEVIFKKVLKILK
jgi:adenylate kinase